MKSAGIVRKVDELGRIIIPIELRRNFNINNKDAMEIYTDEDRIILKKYKPNLERLHLLEELEELKNKITDKEVSEKLQKSIDYITSHT